MPDGDNTNPNSFFNNTTTTQAADTSAGVSDSVYANTTDPGYWQQYNADLLRDQWDYSQWLGSGIEDKFTALLTDPTTREALRNTSMDYVSDSVDKSYQANMGQLARRDAKYGVGLGSLQAESRNNKMQQSAAATKAKGLTDMAGYIKDRDQALMVGGISSIAPDTGN